MSADGDYNSQYYQHYYNSDDKNLNTYLDYLVKNGDLNPLIDCENPHNRWLDEAETNQMASLSPSNDNFGQENSLDNSKNTKKEEHFVSSNFQNPYDEKH